MRLSVVSEWPLVRVVELGQEDLRWDYSSELYPQIKIPAVYRQYGPFTKVDPWGPCYTHDLELVKQLLAECVREAPLGGVPVTVALLAYEDTHRTNAWAAQEHSYYSSDESAPTWQGPGEKPWEGVIALSGKRTEIHPAIARYVVPHEYGHIVEDVLAELRYGDKDGDSETQFRAEYKKMRKLGDIPYYGAQTHHLAPGEVFANDFRAHVMGREQEFWPHPVKPAWKLKRVQRWWEQAMDDLREFNKGQTAPTK